MFWTQDSLILSKSIDPKEIVFTWVIFIDITVLSIKMENVLSIYSLNDALYVKHYYEK